MTAAAAGIPAGRVYAVAGRAAAADPCQVRGCVRSRKSCPPA